MYYAMIIIIKVTTADVRTFPTQYNTYPTPYLLKSEFHYNVLGLSYSSS